MADKKVALYIRVSSEEQKKEGISLEVQENKLKQYCKERNWIIYKIYTDAGVSAKSIEKRKEFKAMLKEAREHNFDAILVTKLDRAFRNTKDAIITSDELRILNIDLISIYDMIDTTTAMGRFFFTINSAYAQLERELTSDRVNYVQEHKFSQGLMIGKSPIGYKFDKNKKIFVVDKKKADMVKEIFEMTKQGIIDKKTSQWNVICSKFKISPQTYYNIIHNKVYIGIVNYKGVEREGSHEKLIDKELFDYVNKK